MWPGALGVPQRFESQLRVPNLDGPVIVKPPIEIFDPAIWQATATLPAGNPQPARLVLREFERYYTDRTIPAKIGNTTHRRRVIEERLVYSEFFPLG